MYYITLPIIASKLHESVFEYNFNVFIYTSCARIKIHERITLKKNLLSYYSILKLDRPSARFLEQLETHEWEGGVNIAVSTTNSENI